MTDPFAHTLNNALSEIRKANANWLGNDHPSYKEGIFLWLAHQLDLPESRTLVPKFDLNQIDQTRLSEAPYMAALALYIDCKILDVSSLNISWQENLASIINREPFTQDRRGIGHNPFILFGMASAILKFSPSGVERKRLEQIVSDKRAYETSDLLRWFCVRLAAYRLVIEILPWRSDETSMSQADRAIVLLTYALHPEQISKWLPMINVENVRTELLRHSCLDDPKPQAGLESLLVHAALEFVIRQHFVAEVDPLGTVRKILSGFEAAMERWPVEWGIEREEHLQDILYLILKPLFPDLVYEDPLPKSGMRSTRPDFGIRSMRLAIEAKYVYRSSDFGKIQQDIESDSVGFFANHSLYDKFVVFVYDASRSVERHHTFLSGIQNLERVAEVFVVSAPGKLKEPAIANNPVKQVKKNQQNRKTKS